MVNSFKTAYASPVFIENTRLVKGYGEFVDAIVKAVNESGGLAYTEAKPFECKCDPSCKFKSKVPKQSVQEMPNPETYVNGFMVEVAKAHLPKAKFGFKTSEDAALTLLAASFDSGYLSYGIDTEEFPGVIALKVDEDKMQDAQSRIWGKGEYEGKTDLVDTVMADEFMLPSLDGDNYIDHATGEQIDNLIGEVNLEEFDKPVVGAYDTTVQFVCDPKAVKDGKTYALIGTRLHAGDKLLIKTVPALIADLEEATVTEFVSELAAKKGEYLGSKGKKPYTPVLLGFIGADVSEAAKLVGDDAGHNYFWATPKDFAAKKLHMTAYDEELQFSSGKDDIGLGKFYPLVDEEAAKKAKLADLLKKTKISRGAGADLTDGDADDGSDESTDDGAPGLDG